MKFDAPNKEVKRGNGKYCSRNCSNKRAYPLTAKYTILNCAYCKSDFKRLTCKIYKNNKSGLNFCNRMCKDKAQSLEGGVREIWPSHFGTGTGAHGYREKAFSIYPHKCNRCLYDKIVGVLQVHHKDRNRNNGNVDNLEILCPTCHLEEHYLAKDGLFNTLSP